MYLYFDNNLNLRTKIPHGDPVRQGNTLKLYVLLDTDNTIVDGYNLRVETVLPDGSTSGSINKESYNSSLIFRKVNDLENTFDIVSGKNYKTYFFSISPTYSTRLAGKINVVLKFEKEVNSSGTVTIEDTKTTSADIFVEKTIGNSNSTVSRSEYEALNSKLTSLLEATTNINLTYSKEQIDEELNAVKSRVTTNETSISTLDSITLPKKSTTYKNVAYINDANGNPSVAVLTSNGTSYTIPIRDSSGNLKVGTALASGDAANKQYVDNKVGEVLSTLEGKKETYVIQKNYEQNEYYYNGDGIIGDETFTLVGDSIIYDVSNDVAKVISFSKLKVGDNIYIKETDIPDYWISSISESKYTFSRLETTKVDIEALSSRITELANKVDSDTESALAYATLARDYSTQAQGYTETARSLVMNTKTRAEYEALSDKSGYYIVLED